MNRKRENELTQLRKDYETQAEENEKTVADLRKKHTQAVTELEEKVDSLQKAKSRYVRAEAHRDMLPACHGVCRLEKERGALSSDHEELSAQLEELTKAKSIVDKKLRAAEEQLGDVTAKVSARNTYCVPVVMSHYQ